MWDSRPRLSGLVTAEGGCPTEEKLLNLIFRGALARTAGAKRRSRGRRETDSRPWVDEQKLRLGSRDLKIAVTALVNHALQRLVRPAGDAGEGANCSKCKRANSRSCSSSTSQIS